MAFTRKKLKSLGLSDEQSDSVFEDYLEVVDELKKERDQFKADAEKYKADADKLPGVQKQLDELKGGEDYKAKYETEHQAFETYKQQSAEKEYSDKVKAAYRKMLKDDVHISDKYLDTVMAATVFTDMKLDKDGNLENADAHKKTASEKWADFAVTTRQRGPKTETPPAHDNGNSGGGELAQLAKKFHDERYGKKE